MATKAPASRARSASRGALSSGCGVGKIERQPGCDDMPIFAGARPHGVNFGADQGGEIAGAQLAGVGDRPIEPVQKMIGHLQEIIARAFIGLDDVHGVQGPIERDECA